MSEMEGEAVTQRLIDLFRPSERQKQFLDVVAKNRFVLYGGAMGGGKSYILRWWLLAYLIDLAERGVPGAQVALFCEDYPALQDRQISKIEMEFAPELGRLHRGTTRDFVLRDEWGGGRIALRNLDDPAKYQSAEFAAIAVDELTKNRRETFDFLRTRLRWPGVNGPRFAAATNPGGVGHGWVKALWVDRKFPPGTGAVGGRVRVRTGSSGRQSLPEPELLRRVENTTDRSGKSLRRRQLGPVCRAILRRI